MTRSRRIFFMMIWSCLGKFNKEKLKAHETESLKIYSLIYIGVGVRVTGLQRNSPGTRISTEYGYTRSNLYGYSHPNEHTSPFTDTQAHENAQSCRYAEI